MKIEFGCQGTQDIFFGLNTKAAAKIVPASVSSVARKKLNFLRDAKTLEDLLIPPGNRLEKLRGDLAGFYSIRINNQYRVVFAVKSEKFANVCIVDYH